MSFLSQAMKKMYESEILQVIHEDMKSMHQAGIIDDERMREYDEMCLVQEPETDQELKKSQVEQVKL